MKAEELLHKIDKRLAVLEALSKAHALETDEQFKEIKQDLTQVKTEVGKLKVKVAGVATIASLIVSFALKQWGL